MKKIDPDKEYLISEVAEGKYLYNSKYNKEKHPLSFRSIQRLCSSGVLKCHKEQVLRQEVYYVKGIDIIEYRKNHKRKPYVRTKKAKPRRASRLPSTATL